MRLPHWKQDSPKMQAVGILGGIEGCLLNLEHGVSDTERTLELLAPLIADLKLLHQQEMPNEWGPDPEPNMWDRDEDDPHNYPDEDEGDYLDRKYSR